MIKVCDYEYEIRKLQEELEKEELEYDRQQLREFIFNQDIKEQFKKNIDELHNKFYDNFDENIPFEQQRIIRKFVDFLKQNV